MKKGDRPTDAGDQGRLMREALAQIRDLRARLAESERPRGPVAIVGVGCRFPGAAGPDAYSDALAAGADAVAEIPRDRWDVDAYYDPDPGAPGKMYTRHGGFIEGVDLFDPQVFGISPLEAAAIDPQHRLLLEVAWEAFEDAGVAADRLYGTSTGVFFGLSNSDYGRITLGSDPSRVDAYTSTGVNFSVAAGRLSYVLGLQGPSMVIDTACSSSLVAVHLACQSLRAGESDLAVVGGVNLILRPEVHVNFCRARMLAVDGRCKTFDAAADGYVRGEGGGAVVLKRLEDAVASGDRVRAVIRGTAVNQDGRSSGLTVPNGPSQEAVIRSALNNAGLSPAELDYVEAHGTGTSLGDPIELRALSAVLGEGRPADRPLLVGSVKTNIGHLEAAAGVAGLIKLVLALDRGEIPRQLHFERMNPNVAPEDRSSIEIVTENRAWARGARSRIAGVSSFGFSGTNAHVVVEEPPVATPPEPLSRPWHTITLSGRTPTAVERSAARLARHLREHPGLDLADVAYSANAGRLHMPQRAAIVVDGVAGAVEQLDDLASGGAPTVLRGRVAQGSAPEVVFFFPGQGAHYAGMARQLYETHPVVKTELERCQAALEGELERPLLETIFDSAETTLENMAHAQPALFAVEWALAELWRSWGVTPAAVVGHSAGEYVAACVAGVMALEDGLRLIAARGRLMSELPSGGAMATVFAPAATVEDAFGRQRGALTLAAVNGPAHVVVSGESGAVSSLLAEFEAAGTTGKLLRISNAYHSPLVEPMLPALEEAAARVTYRPPEVELISNLTGRPVGPREVDPLYWREHALRPVRFSESVVTLDEAGYRVFLEVGPGSTLLGIAQESLGEGDRVWLPSIRRSRGEWEQVLESAAMLHLAGVRVDWAGVDRPFARQKVALPTYPFERERYWVDTGPAAPALPNHGTLWEEGLSAGRAQSEQAPLDLAVGSFEEKWASLERLTAAFQVAALRELGAFPSKGARETEETLCAGHGVADTYRPLLRRWLSLLAEDGLLSRSGDEFVAEAPLPVLDVSGALKDAEEKLADYPELLEYVRRCGPRLAAVLTGRDSALETLFPRGDFSLAEGLYRDSAVSRYLNAIVRAVVGAAGGAAASRGDLRVLEIGAGTGGTTSALASVLPAEHTTYVYTDVSDLFLSEAEKRLAEYPFFRFMHLDIDRSPGEQGFVAGSFDLVIGANVLHATRDLRQTLARTRELLAPGGLLILSETTTHHRVFDITTGLIEGWQLFADDLRADNPLLTTGQWLDLLEGAGFAHLEALPAPGGPADALGNRIIVAATPEDSSRPRLEGIAVESPPVAEPSSEATERERSETTATLVAQLREALPSEQEDLAARHVRTRVMEILRLGTRHTPGLEEGLTSLGLDSLMAVQLRNRLASDIGMNSQLPATLVFEHPSCQAIGVFLVRLLDDRGRAGGRETSPPASPGGVDVETMDEDEAEKALLERLDSIERGGR